MANERLIRQLRQVDVVRRDLIGLLERLGVALRAGIANLRRGVPASMQTPEATKVHVELVQKLDDMHHAVHEARAESVRALVEDEGLPVSTVAHLMGRPRQLVSRLYQQARGNGTGNGHAAGNATGNGRRANAHAERVERLPTGDDPRRSGSSRTTIPPAAR
jgi:hypothetical protein